MNKKINAYIGSFLSKRGYYIERKYRKPQSSLNVLHMGISLLASSNKNISIIQIGAFDGTHADPLSSALEQNDFKVLFVEPQLKPMEALKLKYEERKQFSFENSALVAKDGPITMYINPDKDFSPTASVDREHLSNFGYAPDTAKEISANGISVKTLVEKHNIDNIDVLQIDAEGNDWKVLSLFFMQDIEPLIINIESFHLSEVEREAMKNELGSRNYLFHDHELDTFALKKSLLT